MTPLEAVSTECMMTTRHGDTYQLSKVDVELHILSENMGEEGFVLNSAQIVKADTKVNTVLGETDVLLLGI